MGEIMQVVQVEVFLKEQNPELQEKVVNALRAEIPGCVPCFKYNETEVKFFGLIDNTSDPIDTKMVEKVIRGFGKNVSLWGVHTWDMDIDEPTYENSGR
jgi:Fe-S oxidoreductase